MPPTCTVCVHQNRKQIEEAHLAGQPYREIAHRFAASRDAVYRHVRGHLSARMAKAAERREAAAGESLLKKSEDAERKEVAAGSSLIERLVELNKISRAILADAYKAGERGIALQAITRLEKQLELEARLLGEIKDNQVNVVNLTLAPEAAERVAAIYLRRRGIAAESIETVTVEPSKP